MLEKPRKCRGGAPHDGWLCRNHGPGRVATKPPSNSMGLSPWGSLMMRLRLKSPISRYNSLVLKLQGKPRRPVPHHVLLEGRAATFSSDPGSATEPTACPLSLSLLLCKLRLEGHYLGGR